MRIVIVIGIIY